jgi:N-succinyldiaminopimelate aminotransferase
MAFPERFSNLPDYAFPRLRKLLDAHAPGGDPIAMTIGEPRHAMPDFVGPILAANLSGFGVYPPNDGTPELLAAISAWIARRYGVTLAEDRLMVLNGTREGLFNACIALCPETKNGKRPVVLMPNPFYQVYAVAALTVGAEPVYVPATAATGFLPDYGSLPKDVLDRVALAYICSPANPQGAVASRDYLADLLAWRRSTISGCWPTNAIRKSGARRLRRACCRWPRPRVRIPSGRLVFHSLSKRSNLPGLRSGFVAAGPQSMLRIRQLRAFAGAPLPLPLQRVAEAAWADEAHVTPRARCISRSSAMPIAIFAGQQGYQAPEGGFFLWLPVEDGESGGAEALARDRGAGVARRLPVA